tara:strand:+ start:7733 stop:8509 length:777 start_codon:yes stop_codon:yes gene_type:complete
MQEGLHISIVQANLHWENKKENLAHFSAFLKNVDYTDIILLPEMFNTAFCPKKITLAETMDGETVSWMKTIVQQKKCAIAGTLMIRESDKVYNRLVWISKEGVVTTYDKRHLFSLIKEDQTLTKGKERLIVELDRWKICPLICYDLRFPVFSRNNIDYDLLIYLANWPIKRIDAWDTLLKARSIENQCYTIGVNRVGEDGNGVPFNGHTKGFDAFGNEILFAKENQEELLQIIINLDNLRLKRRQMNFLQDRDDFTLI